MYGCSLGSLSCKNLHIIECALNKIFRRVWNLPSLSHTRIVHCVSNIQSVSNCIFKHFNSMLSGAMSSLSPIIRCVFSDSSHCGHSFVVYNFQYGYRYLKMYFSHDMLCAEVIRHYRNEYGCVTPFENVIHTLSCD